MDELAHGDAMVTIAIVVSRVEAVVLVSVLEAAGVVVHAGGVHHASAEVHSLALGGHRIWILSSQWAEASAVLREAGADQAAPFSAGLQRAVLRFLSLWLGLYGGAMVIGMAAGAFALWELAYLPFAAVVPVNPQGRGDFYFAAEPA